MSNNIFIHPDYLYELFRNSDLSTIRKYCQSNKQITNICSNDLKITQLISKKKEYVQNKTNKFLSSLIDRYYKINNFDVILKTIELDDADILDELIYRGYDPSLGPGGFSMMERNFPVFVASRDGKYNTLNRLLQDPRVDPTIDNNASLFSAVNWGKISTVKRLLQDPRVDPGAQNNRALIRAIIHNDYEIVKILLQDKRVNPTIQNNKIIKLASQNNYIDIILLLLQDNRVWFSLPSYTRKKYLQQINNIYDSITPQKNFLSTLTK